MTYNQSVINGRGLGGSVATQEFFTPETFDILWEALRLGDVTYPLQVRSHGETENERVSLRNRVHTELLARELVDSYGRFEPRVETWLGLLAQPRVSVDALHIPGYQEDPIAILAAADDTNAVVAVQDANGIWLRPTYPDGLVSSVVEMLPANSRGTESSVTLPLEDALHIQPDRMGSAASKRTEDSDGEAAQGRRGQRRQQRALADRGSDPRRAYARLAGQPRLSGGQLAANSRSVVGAKQRSPVLAWFDTSSGRYLSLSRSGSDGREWVTISPADTKTLRTRLNEMLGAVTAGG